MFYTSKYIGLYSLAIIIPFAFVLFSAILHCFLFFWLFMAIFLVFQWFIPIAVLVFVTRSFYILGELRLASKGL